LLFEMAVRAQLLAINEEAGAATCSLTSSEGPGRGRKAGGGVRLGLGVMHPRYEVSPGAQGGPPRHHSSICAAI
jgi:hypothetical protein